MEMSFGLQYFDAKERVKTSIIIVGLILSSIPSNVFLMAAAVTGLSSSRCFRFASKTFCWKVFKYAFSSLVSSVLPVTRPAETFHLLGSHLRITLISQARIWMLKKSITDLFLTMPSG